MKKLIISMVATASIALVAKADGALRNATSFENLDVGLITEANQLRDEDGNIYWTGYSTDSYLEVKELGVEGGLRAKPTGVDRPMTGADSKALAIDVDTPLSRNIATAGGAGEPQAIGTGLYFDSMVQFTATDMAPTPTDGDKLIVWLKEIPVEGGQPTYKLCVTAAELDSASAVPTYKPFETNKEVAPDTWHRLSIAAKRVDFVVDSGESVPVTMFEVYLDSEKVETDGVLYSIVKYNASAYNPASVTSVSFQGKGVIDDLVWTTEDPYASETTTVTVTYNGPTIDAEVGPFFTYTSGETVNKDIVFTDGSCSLMLGLGKPATFTCVIASGWKVDGFDKGAEEDGYVTWTKSVENVTADFTSLPIKIVQDAPQPFTVTIGDATTAYATLADAIAAAAANGATIKLTEDATFTEKVTISSTTVIDLNGRTLTENVDPGDGYDYGAFYVGTKGTLTITDSSEGAKGKIASDGDVVIGNYGTVIVDAGTIESANTDNTVDVSIYNFYYSATVYGKATIKGNVTSVWNCGVLTVDATAAVDYLDNSGAATIADGATVNAVVLMDGSHAAEVTSAGTLTASVSLKEKVSSGVDGYNVAYKDGVYKLEEDVVTVKPGETAEVDTEEAAEAVVIEVEAPADVAITKEDYKAYFEKSIKQNPETLKYEVSAVLKNEVKPVIAATTDDDGVTPAISFGDDGKVTINIRNELPGLFYGVKYATTVSGVEAAEPIPGLTVKTNGGTAGFFRVVVDFKEIPAPAADAE